MKKSYVHLERLPQHVIKKYIVKVEVNNEISSQKILDIDEIKIEEHEDLNDVSNCNFYICTL